MSHVKRPIGLPRLFLLAFLLLGQAAPSLAELDPRLFPVPPELEANVEFWTRVYSEHNNTVVFLHDERHLQVVYAALDFSAVMERDDLSDARKRSIRKQEIQKAEGKYRGILKDLAAGRVSSRYPEDQLRIEELFAEVPGGRSKYTAATSRFRTQTCLRNRFAEAIERSGYYMPRIETIFRQRDLPLALTRLPFVESLFQWNAKSAVAAGGIWQFMPSTARLYMKMELEYDERYDPLTATRGAAQLLQENYKALGTWPLAITAYNHGRGGMKRAVRRLGTRDLGTIATKYRSRTFGFASRNFYAEFVAAANVYANRESLFPGVEPFPELDFEELNLPTYVALGELVRGANGDLDRLKEMNPALSRQVWAGHLYLPDGYPFKVPAGQKTAFESAYEDLEDHHRSPHQVGYYHRVRSGETLGKIARRYGSSISAIQRANRLASAHRIRIGQRLLIPPRSGSKTVTPPPAAPSATASNGLHIVRRGDTLAGIARRYGTSISALQVANGLRNTHHIQIGQRLNIPSDAARTHVVRRGETLGTIAQHYGTSVRALQRANRIRGHIIKPSQILIIP